ncbi:hypothetical protein [Haemophilus haemolyticus]|uniref:hypothetical protein n=1 Tax=Haemophilus haemolyticus TaxID=726 RepID=UPI0015C617E7|nr:hypothetical protein [Haemophilus haemolyticus]NYA48834.1 hypothetical protein [Haemophilus haemolyticus]
MDYREINFSQAAQIAAILLRNDVEIYSDDGTHISENRNEAHTIAERIFMLADLILEKNEDYSKR